MSVDTNLYMSALEWKAMKLSVTTKGTEITDYLISQKSTSVEKMIAKKWFQEMVDLVKSFQPEWQRVVPWDDLPQGTPKTTIPMMYWSDQHLSDLAKQLDDYRNSLFIGLGQRRIGIKKCHQWVEQMVNLVVSYNFVHNKIDPGLQRTFKLQSIESANSDTPSPSGSSTVCYD